MPRRGENIYKRKDGRWEGRYVKRCCDLTGKKQWGSVYAKTYQECRDRLQKARSGAEQWNQKGKGVTLGDWLAWWLEERTAELRLSTLATYQTLIERHILPELGGVRLGQVTRSRLEGFLAEKLKHGRLDGCGGLSPATVRLLGNILSSALEQAWKAHKLPQPICTEVKAAAAPRRAPSAYTEQEQRCLEEAVWSLIAQNGNYGAVLLSLWTGLRVGEVCGLQWRDLELQDRLLRVERTLQRIQTGASEGPKTRMMIGAPKSVHSCRSIPILGTAAALLQERGDTCPEALHGPEDFVFQKNGNPLEPRTLERYHARAAQAAGIRRLTFHALRHTFATRCVEAGMDEKSLSEILGHSSTAITTRVYVHSLIEQKRRGLDKLARHLEAGRRDALA